MSDVKLGFGLSMTPNRETQTILMRVFTPGINEPLIVDGEKVEFEISADALKRFVDKFYE